VDAVNQVIWLLDVYTERSDTVFVLYDDERHLIEKRIGRLDFYGYLETPDPHRVAKELRDSSEADDAWVEKWRKPPFYTETVDVVVFRTKSLRVLKKILETSSSKGLRPLNTFPHPLTEALYRSGIKPLTPVTQWISNKPQTSSWGPEHRDPDISYVLIDLVDGYYTAYTREGVERFWELRDLVNYLISNRFTLGFTDPYIYTQLISVEPGVKEIVYRWIVAGAHHPSEFFEWSRLGYMPLSLMKNISIGRVLTTIEALIARDRRLIVDKTYGRLEPWRSLRELVLFDRGGVVYQPRPGLYWGVCQIDFRSLYPSIIVRYNISGETVDRAYCSNRFRPEWSSHTICLDEEGVVPASLKKLIELKDLYDELAKRTGDELYEYRKSAVKWILVASFGYLGYRNALFGSVMAHEMVTSTSREILRRARISVEKRGYKVIHVIVDSVFIDNVSNQTMCEELKKIIEEATGFRAKTEAYFKWLYIPRRLTSDEAASNKYYGLLGSGEVKIKGVLAVRRDTPAIVKKAQIEALNKLAKAETPQELAEMLSEAHKVIDTYINMLRKGSVEPSELVITRYPRTREEYKKPPIYALTTQPPYRLIYTVTGLEPVNEKTLLRIDLDKYIKLLEKARRELPSHKDLGIDIKR